MRTDLDHLPPQKQRELERVVQLIFEEFDDAFALAKHEWKKAGRILKVILYGSYARGTWVDEPHTAKGYRSDFDLLIIVSDKRLTDRVKYWSKLDERLMREYGVTGMALTMRQNRALMIDRARRLERMGLATEHTPGVWTISQRAEPVLREMGTRGDIIKTMHQALDREGLAQQRALTGYTIHQACRAGTARQRAVRHDRQWSRVPARAVERRTRKAAGSAD